MKSFMQTCVGSTVKTGRFAFIVLTVLLGLTIPAWAKEAEIVGTVTDAS